MHSTSTEPKKPKTRQASDFSWLECHHRCQMPVLYQGFDELFGGCTRQSLSVWGGTKMNRQLHFKQTPSLGHRCRHPFKPENRFHKLTQRKCSKSVCQHCSQQDSIIQFAHSSKSLHFRRLGTFSLTCHRFYWKGEQSYLSLTGSWLIFMCKNNERHQDRQHERFTFWVKSDLQ